MGTILVIDDNEAFLEHVREYVRRHHPALTVQTCNDPLSCLPRIGPGLDLLLLDLEMPGMDGTKILEYAKSRGLSKNRIIVLSGRDAEYLHRRIPLGSCLAVLNKSEAKQKEVLDMVFTSLERHSGGTSGPAT